MKFEDVVRKVRPDYRSKRELQNTLDAILSYNAEERRIARTEIRTKKCAASVSVSVDEFQRACENGMYTRIRDNILRRLSSEIASFIMDHSRVELKNREYRTLEFTMTCYIAADEPDGRDPFAEASNLACR